MWKHFKNVDLRWLAAIMMLSATFLYLIIPPSSPLFEEDYSVIVKAENGSLLHAYLSKGEQWHFPPGNNKPPDKLIKAVITFEDENFYRHSGIDFKAIVRAIVQNIRYRKIHSGASTIPMQVARMKGRNKRSWINKLRETIFAAKLDLHFSKEELLTLYLDHAPYGGNVVGYSTASLMYFGKEANSLTWSEAATLAVLPNAPGLIFPSSASFALKEKRDMLLKKMLEKEIINDQTYQLAKLETVPDRVIRFESKAPHLARRLRNEYPGEWILATTIDERIQENCIKIAERYSDKYAAYDIHNMAILVAETKTGAIKAYLGSPDFFDTSHGGQVDGVLASRSSGSILKPFLYALSFDEGLIMPGSFIRDLPTYFEGFSPRNASREYQGVVTASDALIQSLNIPAVRLLNSYGVFQFYSFLKAAGVSTLFRSADEYGLPLVLGGAEVNMWEMVMLYRGLANGGVYSVNYLLAGETDNRSDRLTSAGSCFLTLEILKDLKRPESEYFWKSFSGSRNFAWKTGTSFGHKDAWAIGVNPEYTIAVWVGNFNGDSNRNLSGAATAGPIMFDILQALPQDENMKWFGTNVSDFKQQVICSLSGFRATDSCPETETIDVPSGMKPLKSCDYHQTRYFSADGLYQCCSRCWNTLGSIEKQVTVYPPDIAFYLREKGQYIGNLVSHYPHCPAYKSEGAVKIIYPDTGARLFLPRDFDGRMQSVICRAGHNGIGHNVYWYLDDQYIGTTEGDHKMTVIFNEGWNTLKVIDVNGSEDIQKVFAVINNQFND
jgi:penicillin-binding protein 1C